MTKLKMIAAAAGLALAAAAAPASAADFTLNLMNGSGSSAYKDYSFQLDGKTVNVRATAWSTANASGPTSNVYDARLGYYDKGLGVLNDSEGSGGGNTHTIDNQNGQDFILFQFDTAVLLSNITTNPFTVSNSTDSDAVIGWANVSTGWNQSLGLDGKSANVVNNMLSGSQYLEGGSSASTRNVSGAASNLWLVGAAANGGADGKIDGFKLGAVTVSSAVPEPATWMMMIGGFAMVGAAVRRRKSVTGGAAIA
ncbi:PEPxxWA-CTERM sorting domain-containing protein [Sphingomonas yunnanensis]|uniref:PEPxxWA-CTERM sorting domain-containing protein n=1 Tax=Sphingomonas yunnanensis TaxID=310400 RepID=UPI001FE91F04|nr:PEPxxWA-CTERM sorting domain-containing protein [Sphingomonas yunnanensis]